MTELQRYLVEEVATDHADGLIPRRDALRRLALLGLGATAAAALLTACSETKRKAPVAATGGDAGGSPGVVPSSDAAVATAAITFVGAEGRTLQGAFAAAAAAPRGAVLVIHENRGLTDHIRNVAGRFAGAGWSALAIDLLSEEGGTAALGDSANATAALGKVAPERFVADMRSGRAREGRAPPRARHVSGRGPRLLQRHRPALQRRRGGRGVGEGQRLVRDAPRMRRSGGARMTGPRTGVVPTCDALVWGAATVWPPADVLRGGARLSELRRGSAGATFDCRPPPRRAGRIRASPPREGDLRLWPQGGEGGDSRSRPPNR